VRAQVSVEASPMRVELSAGPGGTATQAVSLTNAGDAPVRIRAAATDWTLAHDGTPQFEGSEQDGPFSATSWIRVAPPEIVIEPGETGLVRFSLTVPENVTAGGYRTSVLFDVSPAALNPLEAKRGISFKSRIATLVYVDIGNLPPELELTNLETQVAGAQTLLVATVRNPSKRTVRTKGAIRLLDSTNSLVRSMPLPDVPVLPESSRLITAPVADGTPLQVLAPDRYRVEITIDGGQPSLIVGETSIEVPAKR
jgi:P pilus assembly chaperone PapD